MKERKFHQPGVLSIVHRRPREGPPSFLVWTPGCSRIFMNKETLTEALLETKTLNYQWVKDNTDVDQFLNESDMSLRLDPDEPQADA